MGQSKTFLALLALLALPACGLIKEDVDGRVDFDFDINDDDTTYESVGAYDCYSMDSPFQPDGGWSEPDGLRLDGGEHWILTSRKDGFTIRAICSSKDAPRVVGLAVPYTYARYGWSAQGRVFVTTKVSAICGNGILELPEQCDDSNTVDGDGCSATCTIEAACRPEPAPCDTNSQCCSRLCHPRNHTCILG